MIFGCAIIRDMCFHGIPFIGGLIKTAIEKSFTSPFVDDEDRDESAVPVAPGGSPAPVAQTRSRVKGGAYHYSSVLESALGLDEAEMKAEVKKEIKKGIDALGDKAEEVVENLATGVLDSLIGDTKE
jgi:hypothetical protein